MLAVENIDVYYGKVQALHGVSMKMEGNDIISVIGANGAGKTTLMKTVMGINKPKNGTISFNGKVISGMPAHRIVRESIVYVPEGREIFPEMSVYENLLMGAYSKKYTNAQLSEKVNQMYDMFPRLRERAKQSAGSLSGGEQQMLAVARGLMSSPKLIMFDEPSLLMTSLISSFGSTRNCIFPLSWWNKMRLWPCPSPRRPMCWSKGALWQRGRVRS